MSRLSVVEGGSIQMTGEELRTQIAQRIVANPPGVCVVEQQLAMLQFCHAQSCGKCVPCRIGLGQLSMLLEDVLDNRATMSTLQLIREMAENIRISADCAIGFEAANMVLKGLNGFEEDYLSHVQDHCCIGLFEQPIPCVTVCPAHVDVPGYISLAADGRFDDAVRLIRHDNPFPTACALICEHPCEKKCRRIMIDDAVNIRGLKRYAVDHASADSVPTPKCGPSTGKRVAIVGSGPSGLTAAYFLQLMGHQCTVFEEEKQLGGMMRYGIPVYRFPRERLQQDLDAILSTGIEVVTETRIGQEEMKNLRETFDAVYVAIGAHKDKKLGIDGESSKNVIPAVKMLRDIGDGNYPDFTGKTVLVIGGGNVAMDCARTAVRCHAASVKVVYRRRQEDMSALPDEVERAMAEDVEIVTLASPVRIEADEDGNACAFWMQPQVTGKVVRGRPSVKNADQPEVRIACEAIIVAIGQDIDSEPFAESGMEVKRNKIVVDEYCTGNLVGVFAGGECVQGASTVIRSVEGGKVAAANIDEFLGFHHLITSDIEIPEPILNDKVASGRVDIREEEACISKGNFNEVELPMSDEEALREAGRCLRCDRYGCSVLRGGRRDIW